MKNKNNRSKKKLNKKTQISTTERKYMEQTNSKQF